jgi:small subunit ribosomal protein S16
MVKLRLRRQGAKRRPSYRIVAAHDQAPAGGKYIEQIGFYDPITDPATIRLNVDRARYWLSVGAQPTDTVRDILRKLGVLDKSGALIPEAGTYADPLTNAYVELLKNVDRRSKKSLAHGQALAARLAEYTRELGASHPNDPENVEHLETTMKSWIVEHANPGRRS